MKKIIFLILLTPSFLFTQTVNVPSNSAFNTDETNFFVSGNALNDSLQQVNFLLCFMASTKPASFVNSTKPYVAMVDEKKCEPSGTSKDSSKAQGGSANNGGNNGSANNSGTKKTKFTETRNSVVQADSADPMTAKSWIIIKEESSSGSTGAYGSTVGMAAAQGGSLGGTGADYRGMQISGDKSVFLKYSQTANPNPVLKEDGTVTSKFGDFVTQYSMYADPGDMMLGGMAFSDTATAVTVYTGDENSITDTVASTSYNIGNGYLAAAGNTISYKDTLLESGGMDVSITFTATGSEGVYAQSGGWAQDPNDPSGYWVPITKYKAFKVNNTDKFFCTKLIGADALSYSWDAYGMGDGETGTATALTASQLAADPNTYDQNELCFSTDKVNLKKNVYQYGVYDATTGARHGETGGGFPLRADNPSSTTENPKDDLYGYADYWGVWLDTWNATETEVENATWKNASDSSSTETYTAVKTHVEVWKYTTTIETLDSKDNVKLSMYIDPYRFETEWNALLGTSCTNSDYGDANNTSCFSEYVGHWDKDAGGFVFTHGMKWGNGGDPEVDITDIAFTKEEFATAFNSVISSCTDWECPNFWVWSPETYDSFRIDPVSIANPSSTTGGAGIKYEKHEIVNDLTTLPTLVCLFSCIDASAINTQIKDMGDSYATATTADDILTATSGFYPNTGRYYLDTLEAAPFQWKEIREQIAGEVIEYSQSGGTIYDRGKEGVEAAATNGEFNIQGSVLSALNTMVTSVVANGGDEWIKNASDVFSSKGAQIRTADYNSTYSSSWPGVKSISWDLKTGKLVPKTRLSSLECPGGVNNYNDSVRFTDKSLVRYCGSKLDEESVTYELSIRMYPNWELKNSSGNTVTFNAPQDLILDPSIWTASQVSQSGISTEDADKKYRLYFNGFGDYLYIPGTVWNLCLVPPVNEGEYYYGEWNEDCHRYLPKFTIPDGAKVTDSANSSNEYIIKALEGEEMLTAITPKGTDFTGLDKSVLAEATKLIDVGPNGSTTNYIGEMPTDLLNNGDASVSDGKVVFTE